MMCCTLSSANTIGAKQCAALHKKFAALKILPNITNNLGLSGGKTFFVKSKVMSL
jgi:hypothetical protein